MTVSLRRGASAAAFWIASFLAPGALLCIMFKLSGIYPFGGIAPLSSDQLVQYVDFFSWFRQVLLGQASPFYTFAQGLGSNAWGMYSYYLASPVNLLVVLFDDERLPLFFFVASVLKLGLIQISMSLYLTGRWNLGRCAAAALSLSFSCSLWCVTNLRNIMWLDSLYILPLACLAVRTLVVRGRVRGLACALAAAIMFNWYTAYQMICFLFLYLFFEYAWARGAGELPAPDGRRAVLGTLGRFLGAVAIGVGCSAWTFLPTVLAMLGSTGGTSPQMRERVDMVLGAVARVLGGMAPWQLALGILAAAALCAATIRALPRVLGDARRRRVLAVGAGVAAVLLCVAVTVVPPLERLLSLVARCDIPQLLASFLPVPWIPEKTPQLFAGTATLLLAAASLRAPGIPRPARRYAAGMFAFLVAATYLLPLELVWCGMRHPKGFFSRTAIYVVFFMVVLAALTVRSLKALGAGDAPVARRIRRAGAVAGTALVAVCAVEAAACGMRALPILYTGYTEADYEGYTRAIHAQASELGELDGGAWRFAKNYSRDEGHQALNENLSTHLMGTSTFTSANDGDAVALLAAIGYGRGEMPERYAFPSLLTDTLLGVRYVSCTGDAWGYERVLDGADGYTEPVYRNPWALPLGYLVSDGAAGSALPGGSNQLAAQEELAKLLTGRRTGIYEWLEPRSLGADGEGAAWAVDIPEGRIGYACVETGGSSEELSLAIDGGQPIPQNTMFQHAPVPMAPGTHVVTLSGPLADGARCVFAALDPATVEEVSEELGAHPLRVESIGDDRLSGSIDAPGDGLMLLTVPEDGGWSVTVDGEPVETAGIAGGGLMGIPVHGGSNRIEMRYVSPGFVPGCIATVLVLAACGARCLRTRRLTRRRA